MPDSAPLQQDPTKALCAICSWPEWAHKGNSDPKGSCAAFRPALPAPSVPPTIVRLCGYCGTPERGHGYIGTGVHAHVFQPAASPAPLSPAEPEYGLGLVHGLRLTADVWDRPGPCRNAELSALLRETAEYVERLRSLLP